jgi:hypothetical protein
MCGDYEIEDTERIAKVCRYCEWNSRDYVQTLLAYQTTTWKEFKVVLMKEYEKEDVKQRRQT